MALTSIEDIERGYYERAEDCQIKAEKYNDEERISLNCLVDELLHLGAEITFSKEVGFTKELVLASMKIRKEIARVINNVGPSILSTGRPAVFKVQSGLCIEISKAAPSRRPIIDEHSVVQGYSYVENEDYNIVVMDFYDVSQ